MPNVFNWWAFRNTGNSMVNPAVTLGVMPQGQLLTAMEMVFREEPAAAAKRSVLRGYGDYRIRQVLEEQDYQLVNGTWSQWSRQPAGTPDDPLTPDVMSWQPPFLAYIDTPGWSAYMGVGPNTRTLVANGIHSQAAATEVWVQWQFETWVEGGNQFDGTTAALSPRVKWHSSLHLVRATPTAPWSAGDNCRIAHGPMAWGTAQQL